MPIDSTHWQQFSPRQTSFSQPRHVAKLLFEVVMQNKKRRKRRKKEKENAPLPVLSFELNVCVTHVTLCRIGVPGGTPSLAELTRG
uniref:Uncharacterized protein n=1 Tax=Anopheles christyi TaxID=43041 RepID=A0A182KIZ4_9DIPT